MVADALAEAATWARSDGDQETARVLEHVADDIEAASVTPAAADEARLSHEATWHPINIMQRVTPAAIRNAARYLGPSYVASTAIATAAAVARSAGGRDAKSEVLDHCQWAIREAAGNCLPGTHCPARSLARPGSASHRSAGARRKRLGLPEA